MIGKLQHHHPHYHLSPSGTSAGWKLVKCAEIYSDMCVCVCVFVKSRLANKETMTMLYSLILTCSLSIPCLMAAVIKFLDWIMRSTKLSGGVPGHRERTAPKLEPVTRKWRSENQSEDVGLWCFVQSPLQTLGPPLWQCVYTSRPSCVASAPLVDAISNTSTRINGLAPRAAWLPLNQPLTLLHLAPPLFYPADYYHQPLPLYEVNYDHHRWLFVLSYHVYIIQTLLWNYQRPLMNGRWQMSICDSSSLILQFKRWSSV